jgi:non-specific serine/threonine protein kinase
MTFPLFSDTEIERHACRTVLEAGGALFRTTSALKKLHMVGFDLMATFKGKPDCTAVVSRKPDAPLQSICTCGSGYGGACEHVVAAMLAANARQAIQTGLDFENGVADRGNVSSSIPEETVLPTAEIETIDGRPLPRLYLDNWDNLLVVTLRFGYLGGTVEVNSHDRSREKLVSLPGGRIVRLQRPVARELELLSTLKETGVTAFRAGAYTPGSDQLEWVRDGLQRLIAEGFEVFGKESLLFFQPVTSKPALKLSMTKGTDDLIGCELDMEYEGTGYATFSGLYEAVIAGNKYVLLSDGRSGEIPAAWIEKLSMVFALAGKKPENDVLYLRESGAAAMALLESIADSTQWDGARTAGLKLLEDYNGPKPRAVPEPFRGQLRSYQQAGYEWFYFLQEFKINGCLADDMGLGKTIQTIALLLAEKTRAVSPGTSLLVVPTSLLFNWQREFRKFAPSLLVMNYHGRDRKRFRVADMKLADVVLTTYGTVQREIAMFEKTDFNYVILDEAQAIKNPLSENAKTARRLVCRNRLALSGTPMENSLSELWSLFTFLNPGMLGNFNGFSREFIKPIEKDRDAPRAEILRKIIAPCILRRTKGQVAKELPPKTEIIIKAPMTPRQRMLYDMTKEACRASVMNAIDNEGIDGARMHILQALTRLRQICCHPLLVDGSYKGDSCKIDALDGLLENVTGEKHKALVFSQFVALLDLLKGHLDKKEIRYEYLSGRTTDRQKPVDRFQEDPEVPVLLISLKAGGVGLNLTAADYVIMLDPWWNPAIENQAADRAHRIGQTRPVFVYKLIAEDSVEEKVLELQTTKKELFDAIITVDAAVFKNLRREDIRKLFE